MARKRSRFPDVSTIISSDTRILGDVWFSGGLYVNGRIQGNITAEGGGPATLALDEQSWVEGDVRAPHLRLNGAVIGDVYASEHVELLAGARVSGTVYYRSLEMALGAEVNGQLVRTDVFATPGEPPGDETTPANPDLEA